MDGERGGEKWKERKIEGIERGVKRIGRGRMACFNQRDECLGKKKARLLD